MVMSSTLKRPRLVAVVAASVLAVGALWGLADISQAHTEHHARTRSAARQHRRHRHATGADSTPALTPPAFDIHLAPTFDVGQAGWNVVIEESGAFGGSTGIGVIHPSTPLLSVSGSSKGGSHQWRTVAVTLPEVSAVLVEGKMRVPSETLPGLPYGLRAVRVTTPYEEPQGFPGPLASHLPAIKPMVALGAGGQVIPESSSRETRETPFQGTVHRWSSPSGPTQGSCELHAATKAGLIAESGATLSNIRPYPGQIFADAFLPCASTLYSLDGHQLRAYLLLDAAHPGTPPAPIPGLEPMPSAPSIMDGNGGFYGGPTDLITERSGAGWVAVQGGGESERMQLLEDLSASIDL